jgi:HAMP domain-containing protein
VSGTAQAIKIKGESYIRDYVRPLVAAAKRGDPDARSVEKAELGKVMFDDIRSDSNTLEQTEQRVAAERDDRARENANQATIAAIAGLGGTVALIGFFVIYLSRVIARPVRQASLMAERLAGGDLSTRMPETGVAEIGVLEKSFNAMAGSLQRSQSELANLLQEQAALRRVAPPEKVFPAVNEEVARLLDVDGTRLMRYEADATATFVASWGEPTIVPAGTRIELDGRNIASLVRNSGRPARIEGYEDAPGSVAAIAREAGVRSAVGAPITVEGRLWGAMAAFSKADTPLPSGIELRLADFTDLVGTAIANTQARADLTASRARVVAAADDIRRRLERDLHDGTQQRLVSLALEVRNCRPTFPTRSPSCEASWTTSPMAWSPRLTTCGRYLAAFIRRCLPEAAWGQRSRRWLAGRRSRSNSTSTSTAPPRLACLSPSRNPSRRSSSAWNVNDSVSTPTTPGLPALARPFVAVHMSFPASTPAAGRSWPWKKRAPELRAQDALPL